VTAVSDVEQKQSAVRTGWPSSWPGRPFWCWGSTGRRCIHLEVAPPHGSAASAATDCTCQSCVTARDYIADHAEDVMILCPWCFDWVELWEVEDQLTTGRFWCCVMCDMCPDRSWPRIGGHQRD
jgi:hypothetical protein